MDFRDRNKNRTNDLPEVSHTKITTEKVKNTLKHALNWEAAAPNKIQNFWPKKLNFCREPLVMCISEILRNTQNLSA